MFKWLFGARKAQDPASGAMQASVERATDPVERDAVVQAPAVASVVQQLSSPSAGRLEEKPRLLLARSLSILAAAEDQAPAVGVDAIVVAPPKFEKAKVVRVQAGGRRVTAVHDGATKVRAYSRRADGTYRLEGAPAQSATRLVIGATA